MYIAREAGRGGLGPAKKGGNAPRSSSENQEKGVFDDVLENSEMTGRKIWLLGMAAVFAMTLAAPQAFAGDRDDNARFKQDVLKAVERLMDKKLRDFKSDLLKDIRRMLDSGKEKRTKKQPVVIQERPAVQKKAQTAYKKAQEARRKAAQKREAYVKQHAGGSRAHARSGDKDVSVVTTDGKVRVRIEADGKVIEKEFDLGDPGMQRWMKKNIPGEFEIELPGKGSVKIQAHGESRVKKGGSEERGENPRVRVFRKAFPGGPDHPGFEKWLEQMKKHARRWGQEFQKQGKPKVMELQKEFVIPFKKRLQEAEPRKKMQEAIKVIRPKMEGELKKLEKEKDSLKRELAQVRKMIEKLIEQMKKK
jgi:hypothetical protein